MMFEPIDPLFATVVFDRALKMVVIDMKPAEVEKLRQASQMGADQQTLGVLSGFYKVEGSWGTVKLKWHMKNRGGDRADQPSLEVLARSLREGLEQGQVILVPRQSCHDRGVTINDEEGEFASFDVDLAVAPDTSTWSKLDGRGTTEIECNGLSEALQDSLFLTVDQRLVFNVMAVPPGSFVRVRTDFFGPITPTSEQNLGTSRQSLLLWASRRLQPHLSYRRLANGEEGA